MRIKLNQNQAQAFELILRVLTIENTPKNVAELLVFDIVFKIYKKIRAKVEMISVPRSGYSISLTEQEQMAFYIFYQNVFVNTQAYQYEAIILQQIFNQIDAEKYVPIG